MSLVTRFQDQVKRVAELTEHTQEGSFARATGVVRLRGAILSAPWSERDCVAYEISFAVGGPESSHGRYSTFELRPFAIGHASLGEISVDGEACMVRMPMLPPQWARTGDPWSAFRDAHDLYEVTEPLALEELIVEPDVQVTVCGIVVFDRPDEAGYRDNLDFVRRLTGTFDQPLVIVPALDPTTLPFGDASRSGARARGG